MAFHTDAHAGGSHLPVHWFFGTGRYGTRDRACCPGASRLLRQQDSIMAEAHALGF